MFSFPLDKGILVFSFTLHYFVGSTETGTGGKSCGLKRLGEGHMGRGRFSREGERPPGHHAIKQIAVINY